jgi:hypothetical protein
MNNETRYNFVIFGLKKEDFKRFDSMIVESIVENLLDDGVSPVLIDHYLKNYKVE